jgi:HD-like signal output (HDOD) protein
MSANTPVDALWDKFSDRGDFPMLSASLRTTIAAMTNEDYDFSALVNLILSDFALTQRVIRLANSAMYAAFGGNVTTVSRALMILGMEAVGHLIVGLKLLDHFQGAATFRHDASIELNRALLSGSVARQLARRTNDRRSEEAVVCTLMRQVGKLLVVCYLERDWDRIQSRARREGRDDSAVCVDELGASFEELAQEAARRWRLPDTIRQGMQPAAGGLGPTTPAVAMFLATADAAAPATGNTELTPSHIAWLQAVTGYSTAVSEIVTQAGLETGACDEALVSLAGHYGSSLSLAPETLVQMTRTLVEENVTQRFVEEIELLRGDKQPATPTPEQSIAIMRAGLADLNALPESQPPKMALAAVCETLGRALGLARVTVFERARGNGIFSARLGAGRDIERLLPELRFSAAFSPDVFHLALRNGVGMFIADAHAPSLATHMPAWFTAVLPDTCAFVLLPVRVADDTVALVYGDWNRHSQVRKIAPEEMATLNEFSRRLGRFFASAPMRV